MVCYLDHILTPSTPDYSYMTRSRDYTMRCFYSRIVDDIYDQISLQYTLNKQEIYCNWILDFRIIGGFHNWLNVKPRVSFLKHFLQILQFADAKFLLGWQKLW
jgi:hypothetical protein